ncbi:MAG: shikimate dehydrogenase [Saprospiraceae bacterium]|nr:shikimate dehydrogenase [Lewinellaceae bacterium]
MNRYGIIGYPLGHSFSRQYFTEKFAREGIADSCYDEFPLPDIQAFPELLAAHPDLRGLNVTIPHKEAVMPYLDALDETAAAIGAVNTIRIKNGHCTGFNTDAAGLEGSLQLLEQGKWLKPIAGASALILGTGGAAKAVAFVLRKNSIPFRFVSRHPQTDEQVTYASLQAMDFDSVRWIFNATPLGTHPIVDVCPELPYHKIHAAQLVYDLVYNPAETLLLQRAKAQGATVKNGLEMLFLQAEAAWAIWQKK